MECTVTWTGATGTRSAMGFVAETGSGHVLSMDGAPDAAKPENGGANLAPRPMETVLAGTGGCTAYDVVLILKRGRHDVRGCSVKLTSERAVPAVTPDFGIVAGREEGCAHCGNVCFGRKRGVKNIVERLGHGGRDRDLTSGGKQDQA